MIPNFLVATNEFTKLTFLYVLAVSFQLDPYLSFLLTLWIVSEFLGSYFLGRVSDKWGRKNTLMLSLFFSLLSIFLLALSVNGYHKNEMLAISILLNGLFGNFTPVSKAAFIDMRPHNSKRRLFAVLNLSISFPWLIFPLMYIFFSPSSAKCLFFDIIITILAIAVCLFFKDKKDAHQTSQNSKPFPFANRYILYALGAFLLSQIVYQVGAYIVEERGAIIFISKAYFLFGLGFAFGSAVCLFLKEGVNHRKFISYIFLAGGGFFILKFLSFSWETPSIFFDKSDFTFLAFISGLYLPSIYALLSDKAHVHQQGQVCGALESIQSVGEATAPLISRLLILSSYDVVFLIFATILIFSGYILRIATRFPGNKVSN